MRWKGTYARVRFSRVWSARQGRGHRVCWAWATTLLLTLQAACAGSTCDDDEAADDPYVRFLSRVCDRHLVQLEDCGVDSEPIADCDYTSVLVRCRGGCLLQYHCEDLLTLIPNSPEPPSLSVVTCFEACERGYLRCATTPYLLPPEFICDGAESCPGGDDELYCE